MKGIVYVVIVVAVLYFAKGIADDFTANTQTSVNNHHAALRSL